MGSQEPSVRVAPEYTETDGWDAVKVLRAGHLYPDPWQENVLMDWMARDGDDWAAPSCGLSVPRQNGKTLNTSGRIAAGMILYNEWVIYTAHLQKTATETFMELRGLFESRGLIKQIKEIKTALGREQIILKNGGRCVFVARTRNGGRGLHGDLLVFDEAQELTPEQQASFLPALAASRNPQTIYLGTPPDENSDGGVFRNLRQKALDGDTEKAVWSEFSVPEIGDVSDKRRWAATNPALGRRIRLSTIESEFEQMDQDTFARERLGWWSPVYEERIDYAISKDVWDACKSDLPKPEGKTAFGVKFSVDGSEVSLCGAVIPKDGPARISLIDKISGVWKAKNSIVRPSSKDVISATSELINNLNEQTVTWFSLQEGLRDSALSSVKRPIGGGWGFGGDDSTPIEAASLALWGAKTSKRNPNRKMRIG